VDSTGVPSPSEPCGRSALESFLPLFDHSPGVGEAREPVLVETIFAKGPAEAFDKAVLGRFAGFDEPQGDAPSIRAGVSDLRLTNWAPLSTMIVQSRPRDAASCCRTVRTQSAGNDASTAMAGTFRVQSSTILTHLNRRPEASVSRIESRLRPRRRRNVGPASDMSAQNQRNCQV